MAKVGGANHFLVVDGPDADGNNLRYGLHSMELLINALLRNGASRQNLEAKVFGGARMFDEMADIGRLNAEFALKFLEDEAIPCKSQSVLGRQARRLRFWPATGRAQQRMANSTEVEPNQHVGLPYELPQSNGIELF